MKHKIEIVPNNAIYIDGERTIGSKPYGLFLTTTMIVSDDDLKRLANRCLAVIADRKTEPSNSEIPNNCEVKNYCDDCLYTDTCDSKEFFYACTSKATISKMEQVDKDINVRSKDCETCKHYKLACELFSEICKYEPITQTETQNSNLTFKTLEYCDICDHKGCEECIANALDEHCMPSQFNKQIEDACAKEYEELGLKELKELIEADRKTEPPISKMEQVEDEPQTMLNDGTLVINVEDATKVSRVLVGDDKNRGDLYYPDDEDEPQTELVRVKYHCINCAENGSYKCSKCDGEMYYKYDKDEPQTDCAWK